ncbi:energy coupling factor transporter S component ThiW [Pontibacillus litoralis]|uniref:ThiW protein n=1 Tax=Pontibacillus litoralis JSM 072002 TaxID=1385512 RepID=A0A0A5G1C5_9BACI|nr:energy coupling factor transporter S component ThiW [Pontibacillus litoralis]KGX84903.1 thiW protein [Pontibacillus litoralis JSM 072002]
MRKTQLLTTMAILIAIGTLGSQLLWFPAGIAKAYPVQHAVNVIAAITLGPVPAVVIAFIIGLLRMSLGLGTLLAFPGGMIGACLAGMFYKWSEKKGWAATGEIIGTGVIGALFAVPYAHILMGSSAGAFLFVPPFLVSSISGAFIGLFILSRVKVNQLQLKKV